MIAAYNLPNRQMETLKYIIRHIKKFGQSPTLAEIGNGIGCSVQNARRFVVALEKKGHIQFQKWQHRSIKVLQ